MDSANRYQRILNFIKKYPIDKICRKNQRKPKAIKKTKEVKKTQKEVKGGHGRPKKELKISRIKLKTVKKGRISKKSEKSRNVEES